MCVYVCFGSFACWFWCENTKQQKGEEVLLGGTRATPKKLLDSGFQFLHPTIEEAVQSAVTEKDI
jgi:NAD dependent epimerase/dehydratase family enzyme